MPITQTQTAGKYLQWQFAIVVAVCWEALLRDGEHTH